MNKTSKLIYSNKIINEVPTLSIIIPTYNRIITLKEAVESIKPNNELSYEVIIVDNSNINDIADTLKYLKSIKKLNLFYYVNNKNLGMVGNWNSGLNLATGKYVAYLHDDDLLDKCYFDVVSHILNDKKYSKERIGFIKAKFDSFNELSDIKHTENLSYSYKKIYKIESLINGKGPTGPPTCGILFNREALLKLGGFDEKLYPCADHIIGFQLQEKGYYGYVTIDTIGHYRWGINETLKKETLVSTVEKNYFIRNSIYNNNLFYSIYGLFFKNIQYTNDVNSYMHFAKRKKIDIKLYEIVSYKSKYIKNVMIYIFLNTIYRIINKILKMSIK